MVKFAVYLRLKIKWTLKKMKKGLDFNNKLVYLKLVQSNLQLVVFNRHHKS